MISVGIIDDNENLIRQLTTRLELSDGVQVLFTASGGKAAISWLKENHPLPDLLLMDVEMPGMDGIETTFRIKQQFSGIKVVMLTVFETEQVIFNAIKAGATGYLLKDETIEKMLQAFDEVLKGGAPMSPAIAAKSLQMLVKGYKPDKPGLLYDEHQETLTKREVEILEWLTKGYKNSEVADRLFVSEATIKKHIENIYQKLQLHSRVELVNWYNKGL